MSDENTAVKAEGKGSAAIAAVSAAFEAAVCCGLLEGAEREFLDALKTKNMEADDNSLSVQFAAGLKIMSEAADKLSKRSFLLSDRKRNAEYGACAALLDAAAEGCALFVYAGTAELEDRDEARALNTVVLRLSRKIRRTLEEFRQEAYERVIEG